MHNHEIGTKLMKRHIAIILTVLFAGAAYADAPNGLAFLKISPDVRSGAMGETGTAAGYGSAASFYNPALLTFIDGGGVSFSHHRWIQDINLNFIEAHFRSVVNIGFSVLSTGVDDIEVRRRPSPQPTAYVDSKDLAFGMHLSRRITDNLGLGAGVKFISEHIYYSETSGWAFDFGLLYRAGSRFRAGAALTNAGRMSVMENERPQLPWAVKTGAAYEIPLKAAGNALIAAQVSYVNQEEMRGGIGLEWRPRDILALRGGYLFNYDERGVTAGLGLRWGKMGFDFAYMPFGSDLGSANRFSLTLDF